MEFNNCTLDANNVTYDSIYCRTTHAYLLNCGLYNAVQGLEVFMGWAYTKNCKVAGRGWKYWYKLPFIDYNDGAAQVTPPSIDVPLGSRLLKCGDKGGDVKAMQELLLQLGYALPKYGADGEFGSETEKAVLAFQKEAELEQDGKYGDKTHAALMDAVADDDEGKQDEPQPVEPEKPKPAGATVVIVSEGGKVNIRCGNGTEYSRLSSVAPGTTFAYVATAENGWHAVVVNARVGWVSGKYSKVME